MASRLETRVLVEDPGSVLTVSPVLGDQAHMQYIHLYRQNIHSRKMEHKNDPNVQYSCCA